MSLEILFERACACDVEKATDVLYADLQKYSDIDEHKLGTLVQKTYKHYFDKIFQYLAQTTGSDEKRFDQKIYLIEKLGVNKDSRAITALWHQITGLEYSEPNRKWLINSVKNKTSKNDLLTIFETFYEDIQDSKTDKMPAKFKIKAMKAIIKLTEDTRAIASIGFRCIEKYEPDDTVRRAAIKILTTYASSLAKKNNFRLENPSLIFYIFQSAGKDSLDGIRKLSNSSLKTIAQHIGKEVLDELKSRLSLEKNEKNRIHLMDQIKSITELFPDLIQTTMESICSQLFDGATENRKKAIYDLFNIRNWELIIQNMEEETGIGEIFNSIIRFLQKEPLEELRNQLYRNIQDEKFIFFKVCRDDKSKEFETQYNEIVKNIEETIAWLRNGIELLIGGIFKDIQDEDGYYSNAIEAIKSIQSIANRNNKQIRQKLIEVFQQFEYQGQTFDAVGFNLEESIDHEAFLSLPCSGGNCVLENKSTNEEESIPNLSTYYDKDDDNRAPYIYKKYDENCFYQFSLKKHIIVGFYDKRTCYNFHKWKKGTFNKPNKNDFFEFGKFIKQSKSKPVISKKASDHIRVLRTHSNKDSWKIGIDYYDELTALPETTYPKVYKKRPTDISIDKLLPQKNPEREFIMETLNAMKILSISDIKTQEFLFKTFGRDVEERHWHKDTRIAILDTIAKIAKGESLPAYKKQKAEELLTSIDDSRGEDQDIINASMKALKEILTSDKEIGGEMMLASDKAIIVNSMEQNNLPNVEKSEEISVVLQDNQEKLNEETQTVENVEHELMNESNQNSDDIQIEQNIHDDNEAEKDTNESDKQIEQNNISESDNIEPPINEESEKESLQKNDNDELPIENATIDEKEHDEEKKTEIEADATIETQIGLTKNEETETPDIQLNYDTDPSQEISDLPETKLDAETEFDEEKDILLDSKNHSVNGHDIENQQDIISSNEKNITIEPQIDLTLSISNQSLEDNTVETETQSLPIKNEQDTIENSRPQNRSSRFGRLFKRKKKDNLS